jgi:hypothetical protein
LRAADAAAAADTASVGVAETTLPITSAVAGFITVTTSRSLAGASHLPPTKRPGTGDVSVASLIELLVCSQRMS